MTFERHLKLIIKTLVARGKSRSEANDIAISYLADKGGI